MFLLLVSITFFGLTFSFSHGHVKAEDSKTPLTVEPIYPKNQNPETKGYFDLSVNPGDHLSIKVKITNKDKDAITIKLKAANAFTNPSGGIMYEKNIDSADTILLDDAIRMDPLIHIQDTVTVPPQSSVEVPIKVSVSESVGQNLLGGILFTIQGKDSAQQKTVKKGTANFVLKTETVYAVAIQLNLPNKVPTKFRFGEAGFVANRAQVFIEMTNDAQKIQEGVTGTYAVSDGKGKALFNGNFGPFKMAPKTKIRYPIQWDYKTLENGTYTLSINGTINGEKLNTSKTIKINSNDVQNYIKHAEPNLPQGNVNKGIPIWVWVAGAGVLFGLVMFFMGKRRT